MKERHNQGEGSRVFWSKTKRHFKSATVSLQDFILPDGQMSKDPRRMVNAVADHYESLFKAPEVYRPHPYVDLPMFQWDNMLDPIPKVTYAEVLKILADGKKKYSRDAHGLSPLLLYHIPRQYWHLLASLFNYGSVSFQVLCLFIILMAL